MKLKRLWIIPRILLLSLALVSCNGANQQEVVATEAHIALEVDPDPPTVGPSHLAVTVTDAEGTPLEGATVKVEGRMSHDDMQPLQASLRAGESGTYGAPFNWTMDGDWHMAVSATLPDGQELTREFHLSVQGEMSGERHDHSAHEVNRLPNEGALIRIVSPTDGEMFEAGSDVRVEVEFENFDLNKEGNHWHVYVDDQSSRMIMGGMIDAVLRDLEPGQHKLSAYMSVGKAHDELEEGAAITITIMDHYGEQLGIADQKEAESGRSD